MTDRSYVGSYDSLNIRLLQWLQEDRALGIVHETPMVDTHIITLWGLASMKMEILLEFIQLTLMMKSIKYQKMFFTE
ncbi:hypothetical protein EI377_00360 [Clostridium septicum]|nr:hypothetical protein [Clostridium septicum]QAS59400.1 hypothetical protein EI377_00360 [Clostridium septicum]